VLTTRISFGMELRPAISSANVLAFSNVGLKMKTVSIFRTAQAASS